MKRQAFTLIEIMVVITISLILAGIIAAFAPGFRDRQKVPRAADQLQGWLAISRQWAKRDRVPTGVRLIFEQGSNVVTELQYIQQPPNFMVYSSNGTIWPISISGTNVTLIGSPASSGFLGGLPKASAAVQPGDYLVAQESIRRIKTVNDETSLTLESPFACCTLDYYIARSPRPIVGEASLKLPQDTVIDFRGRSLNASSSSTDIVFSPSGELISPVVANAPLVVLWICDNSKLVSTSANPPAIGDDLLITVNPRTGMVACQQVGTPGSPYSFCYDGRSSGM